MNIWYFPMLCAVVNWESMMGWSANKLDSLESMSDLLAYTVVKFQRMTAT